MKNLLLLCQSQADVDSLAAAASAIKRDGYDGLWLLFSPAVLVDSKAASAEHDANITALRAAVDRCKSVDDFDGAKGYKAQMDDAILQKTVKVKEAWKTLTPAQKEEASAKMFDSFIANCGVAKGKIRVEQMRDHYETAQFVAALNAQKPMWFVPFTPGTFMFGWVASFTQSGAQVVTVTGPKTEVPAPTAEAPKERALLPTQHPRFKQLVSMGLDGLAQHAMTLGLNPNQFPKILALRHAVFKKEKELGKVAV